MSDDHAWVLPSYYSPNWWKQSVSEKETSDCSDGQMRKILETIIFIDTVKFPPMVYIYIYMMHSHSPSY